MPDTLDLEAAEARLNALRVETTREGAHRALAEFLNSAPVDMAKLIAKVRQLTTEREELQAEYAKHGPEGAPPDGDPIDGLRAIVAQRDDGRCDGARAMQQEVEARALGVAERHEGFAKSARAKNDRNRAGVKQAAAEAAFEVLREIRALDPAAVARKTP